MNSIVALPIAAALPVAPPALPKDWPQVVDPVIAASERAIAAWTRVEETSSNESKTEDVVIDWVNANPRPAKLAALKENEEAVREWEKRKRAIEKASGHSIAARACRRANSSFDEARDELCAIRPTSLEGLRAKARAARHSSDDDLQQQIVWDIGVLLGDLDHREKPMAGARPFTLRP